MLVREHPKAGLAEPVGVQGDTMGTGWGHDGDTMGTGCPKHPPVPTMAHARPQQLLGQGLVSLPIKPPLSPGTCGVGDPPWGGGGSPSPSLCSTLHSHCSLPAPHSCAWPQWPLLAASPAPAALPRPLPRGRATPLAAEAEKSIPVRKKKKKVPPGRHQLRRRAASRALSPDRLSQ